MKQIHKSIIHASLHLMLFAGVVFAVSDLHPSSSDTPSPVDETAGGSPYSAPAEKARADSSAAPKPDTQKASQAPKRTIALAPAYDKIKQTVKHEYVYRAFATPNDPGYSSSDWALNAMNATAAWDIATGDGSTVVAVIDTGFALNHEDLSDRYFQNGGETGMTQDGEPCWTGTPENKFDNDCDDDQNGYVDDWIGWNFVLGDNSPQAGRQDANGESVEHGTEVAGIVGAAGNNATGITALNWNTDILPLQVLDDDGTGFTSDVAAAIYYAVDNGADVINMSLGTNADDPAVKAAINHAISNDVVVVAAAGNCGNGIGEECENVPLGAMGFPAVYPDVIAVGATNSSNQRASFSSYGTALDVTAPGSVLPISTTWTSGNPMSLYVSELSGTSFSSPFVASLAALIKSIRPSSSVADITAIINGSASKPSGMNGAFYTKFYGHGIVDAEAALTIASALNTTSDSPTLLQTGTVPKRGEHIFKQSSTLISGCLAADGDPCTVELSDDSSGHSYYLPYKIASDGGTSWSWPASTFSNTNIWEVRARIGDNVTDVPYILIKKG